MANATTAQKIQAAQQSFPAAALPQPIPGDKTPKKRAILSADVHMREQRCRDMVAYIDVNLGLDDILVPEFWSAKANLSAPGSTILCIWKDNSRRVELWVRSVGKTWVTVMPVSDVSVEPTPDTPASALYKVENVASGWRVVSKDTGKVLVQGLRLREEAEAFVEMEIKQRKQ